MISEEKQAIEQLFAKLDQVERQGPPRDAEAEAYIRERIAAQPGAPYYMAQTIVMQEQALQFAQQRIAELEQQAAVRPSGGGFLSGLFGGGQPPRRAPMQHAHRQPMQPGYGQAASPGRGGFLAGAAQTAMGVAGGVLLGNMVANMFGGGGPVDTGPEPQIEPASADEGFDFFGEEEI